MHKPFIRQTVRLVDATAAGGRLHTWNDLLATFPGLHRRQDRPHERRRLVAGRGRARRRRHDLRDAARRRDARRPERRPRGAARLGALALPDRLGDRRRAHVRHGADRVREPAGPRSSPRSPRSASSASSGRSSSGSSSPSRSSCRCGKGQRLGEVQVLDRGKRARPLAARRRDAVERPGALGRVGFYAGRTLDHLGGSSRDRHRHAERRARPHADRAELPARPPPPRERGADARRRQGHQRRARAEAARRPGRRDRPRRRPHRARASSRS